MGREAILGREPTVSARVRRSNSRRVSRRWSSADDTARQENTHLHRLGRRHRVPVALPVGSVGTAFPARVRWELVDGPGRPVVGDVEHRPYLEFARDSARFAGSTGHNRLTGRFERNRQAIRSSTIHWTSRAVRRRSPGGPPPRRA